jgi:hypothetical protein
LGFFITTPFKNNSIAEQGAPFSILRRTAHGWNGPVIFVRATDQKSNLKESCPVRFPLFSAVCTLCTTPNEDAVTFVGGGAKFG